MAVTLIARGTPLHGNTSPKPEGRLPTSGDFSLEELCGRILVRHRDKIGVRKPAVATANLTRIVGAILKLSNRKGFHATTLRDLADESGLSMGSLYNYFDSKDTLLLMILGEVADAAAQVLRSAPADVVDDPAMHLRWLIGTHVALTEVMLPWFVFAFMEAKSFPAQGRKLAVESELATETIFADVVEEGARRGIFAVEDPAFAAALIKPLLQDWYVKRSKWRRRGMAPGEYADRVCEAVEGMIGLRRPETVRPA